MDRLLNECTHRPCQQGQSSRITVDLYSTVLLQLSQYRMGPISALRHENLVWRALRLSCQYNVYPKCESYTFGYSPCLAENRRSRRKASQRRRRHDRQSTVPFTCLFFFGSPCSNSHFSRAVANRTSLPPTVPKVRKKWSRRTTECYSRTIRGIQETFAKEKRRNGEQCQKELTFAADRPPVTHVSFEALETQNSVSLCY